MKPFFALAWSRRCSCHAVCIQAQELRHGRDGCANRRRSTHEARPGVPADLECRSGNGQCPRLVPAPPDGTRRSSRFGFSGLRCGRASQRLARRGPRLPLCDQQSAPTARGGACPILTTSQGRDELPAHDSRQEEGTREPTAQEQGRIVAYGESFAGPLPHPKILAGYEEIVPGAAREILETAHSRSQHRQAMERDALHARIREERAGVGYTFRSSEGISMAVVD